MICLSLVASLASKLSLKIDTSYEPIIAFRYIYFDDFQIPAAHQLLPVGLMPSPQLSTLTYVVTLRSQHVDISNKDCENKDNIKLMLRVLSDDVIKFTDFHETNLLV